MQIADIYIQLSVNKMVQPIVGFIITMSKSGNSEDGPSKVTIIWLKEGYLGFLMGLVI